MSEKEIKINCTNFNPSHKELINIRSIAADLYYLSPSDSILKISLEKFNEQFHCRIEVNSTHFRERAYATERDLPACVESGTHDLFTKVDQWKKNRFKDLAG